MDSRVILAVGSPPGRSPRGIVRMSGDDVFRLLSSHLTLESRHAAVESAPSGLHAARLALGDLNLPALALLFAAPRSYTGEHAAELQLPGNPVLLDRVINALIDAADRMGVGARRAHPGEFTARAFFNGKLGLTQAEGVAATIAAQSDAELAAARLLAGGTLALLVAAVADDLLSVLALVEAGIDFTDQEDVVPIGPGLLNDRLCELRQRLDSMLARAVGTEQLQAIPWVVLTGQPNAGKSTLFNALLGRERAVVSPIAGTTRDVLTEPMTIQTPRGPAEVMLVDLAGVDSITGGLNEQMQAVAQSAIARADLILHCVESSEPPVAAKSANELIVRTKSDLPPLPEGEGRGEGSSPSPSGRGVRGEGVPNLGSVSISALTSQGMTHLRQLITRHLSTRAVSLAADALALQPRHDAALRSARDHITAAIDLLAPFTQSPSLRNPELIASSLRAALDELGKLTGTLTPDDILGRIFATFCIGK